MSSHDNAGHVWKAHNNNPGHVWKGYNIHRYTSDIAGQLEPVLIRLQRTYPNGVNKTEFMRTLEQLKCQYGNLPAIANLQRNYNEVTRTISDPTLPNLNSAAVLHAIWRRVQELNDSSIHAHFLETLIDIGSTCIQGISHRLLDDYLAIVLPHPIE